MNRKGLAKELAKKTHLRLDKAEKLIVAFGDVVENALAKGDKIVYSNFGTFYTVHYPSKIIYHPKLGKAKQMIMLPTNVVKWMPSGNIKDLVNSELQVDDMQTLTAHGIRKFTGALNHAPKSTVLRETKTEDPTQSRSEAADIEEAAEIVPIKTFSTKKIVEPQKILDKETIAVQEKPDVNIYEEMMEDGSKIESTFKDAIRVPRKSFLGRLFDRNKTDEIKEASSGNSSRVSLKDAGIFSKEKMPSSLPEAVPAQNNLPRSAIQAPEKESNSQFQYNFHSEEQIDKQQAEPESLPPLKTELNNSQIDYIDLSKTIVPKEILHRIPEKIARQYKVVPIDEKDKEVTVAMVDPQDLEAKEMIKKLVSKPLTVKLSSEEDINHILDQYSGLENELSEAIKTADNETNLEEADKIDLIESASDNAPAARIVTSLLRRAIRDKASDIHIEPEEEDVLVRFRQDGILRKTVTLPKDLRTSIVSRIKILANMKIDEQRLPQDGRFSIKVDERKVDFRVSSMPVANGEKIVMRVLDKLTGILTIEQLGIHGSGLKTLQENLKKSHGMLLVTGPTGSGKTTTLYALIDKLYSEGVNIVTLEDPIEYRMPGINQSQVNAEIKYTFASGLRSIVRQDPDIIMIGEIRDSETAEMAVHAALTGHIVLSTLHTNDSAGAAPRLLDMGVEPFLLTSSLNIVIAQRLARKICEDCKEEFTPSEVEIQKIKVEIQKMPESERPQTENLKFFRGKGCKNCGDSGYKGRIGLYEVLEITEPLKELILKKESSFKIQELAIKNGMVTMLGDGILKAIDGKTTLEEVWRTTEE